MSVRLRLAPSPTRQALTGRPQGLRVATLLWVLGPDVVRRRLERALATLTV